MQYFTNTNYFIINNCIKRIYPTLNPYNIITLCNSFNTIYIPLDINKTNSIQINSNHLYRSFKKFIHNNNKSLNLHKDLIKVILDTLLPNNTINSHISTTGVFINKITLPNTIQYVSLSKKKCNNIKIIWPFLNIIQELNKIINKITDQSGIVTTTITLIILVEETVNDIQTNKPINIDPTYTEIIFENNVSVNNVTIPVIEPTICVCYKTQIPFTAQIFLFKTNNLLNEAIGDFTVAIIILTDFTGLATFYLLIIDNDTNNLLTQIGQSSFKMTFYRNCDNNSWSIDYDVPYTGITLNYI